MSLTSPRFAQNARLQKASENNPALRQGESGEGVKIYQLALIDLGFDMPGSTKGGTKLPDGIFGPETAARSRDFQKAEGLVADAVVGRMTLAALESDIIALTEANAAVESTETRPLTRPIVLNSLIPRV